VDVGEKQKEAPMREKKTRQRRQGRQRRIEPKIATIATMEAP
jgi:hypothetical protein